MSDEANAKTVVALKSSRARQGNRERQAQDRTTGRLGTVVGTHWASTA